MTNLTFDNITETVIQSTQGADDERLRDLLKILVQKLHEFARETSLSHAEWEAAMGFLMKTADISDDKRNEFILLSDLFGLSSLVDMIASNAAPETSERSVLGPFYRPNAPFLEIGGDLIRENEGERIIFQGHVRDTDGNPIKDALIDSWQNAANGEYENVDPIQPDMNLRCRMRTDENGYYGFSTTKPVPYKVPDDGSGGIYMQAVKRHCWRPCHMHVRLSAEGYEELVTEIFNETDPYNDSGKSVV